jgi:excisionase family DNA binding protein
MEEKQLLSLDEAAARLGVSWQTCRRWASIGRIASVRMGRLRKIPSEEIERLIREGTHPAHEAR